jgi:hypothetical protein
MLAQPELKTCPDCAEEVKFAARKCRFCGYEFYQPEARETNDANWKRRADIPHNNFTVLPPDPHGFDGDHDGVGCETWRLPIDHDEIGTRIIAAVGEAGARELLGVLTRSEADRAALVGRLLERASVKWLAELLIDLEEDEPARLHLIEALRRIAWNEVPSRRP